MYICTMYEILIKMTYNMYDKHIIICLKFDHFTCTLANSTT